MRRLAGILATLGLLFGLLPVVGPAALAVPCGNPKVTLYENVNAGGDFITYCNAKGNADLRTHPHVPAGTCETLFNQPGDTWDNCVSSIKPVLGAGVCLYLYNAINYQGFYRAFAGPLDGSQVFSWFLTDNDVLSSFRFKNKVGGVCPAR